MKLEILAPRDVTSNFVGEVSILLREVFTKKVDWEEKTKWLYLANPRGSPWCVSARDESGRIIAHSAMVPVSPLDWDRYQHLPVWFSLNTAVRSGLESPGLMVFMIRAVIQAIKESGPSVLLGCANANSTIGFVKLLKYRLLGSMHLGVLPPWHALTSAVPRALRLDHDTLAWRAQQPGARLRMDRSGGFFRRLSYLAMPLDVVLTTSLPLNLVHELRRSGVGELGTTIFGAPRLYGVFGVADRVGVPVPKTLRPSPLNYICRSLAGDLADDELEAYLRCRRFELVDFDVV